MRRVCGFDTLSAHLVRKSLSLSLSVTLGVLPMAPAFAREDERYSYSASNRYQDYQNQYKPEKNYSASSQLDRQIRMQNTALALRFQAPTGTSLGRMSEADWDAIADARWLDSLAASSELFIFGIHNPYAYPNLGYCNLRSKPVLIARRSIVIARYRKESAEWLVQSCTGRGLRT
jgi:hypothetical protein